MNRFSRRALQVFIVSSLIIAASLNGGCRSIEYFSQVSHADQFGNAFGTDMDSIEATALRVGTLDLPRRNEFIAMKLFEVDRNYYYFLTLLNVSDTGIASFADFAQLGLTTAATAIPLVQTTKVLATAATAVGGARAVYNQDLLRTQTLQAIQTQMDADRLKIRGIIITRMDECQTSQYPMGFVLADLQAYAAAGTPDSAIAALASSANKAKQAASTPSNTASADSSTGGGEGSGASRGAKKGDPIPVLIEPRLGKLSITYTPPNNCPLPGKKPASAIAARY
jgi:hypothetical protein